MIKKNHQGIAYAFAWAMVLGSCGFSPQEPAVEETADVSPRPDRQAAEATTEASADVVKTDGGVPMDASPNDSTPPLEGGQIEPGRCRESDGRWHDAIAELCNGLDDDCDGETDEMSDPHNQLVVEDCRRRLAHGVCAQQPLLGGAVCAREGGSFHPRCVHPLMGVEVCNGLDDNCDGRIDEDLDRTQYCGEGPCRRSVRVCVDGVAGPVCVAQVPVAELDQLCNGVDDDCDGRTDEDIPVLDCGYGPCRVRLPGCVNGVETECSPLPAATPEICNGIDDDCNGVVDDGAGCADAGR